MSNRSAHVIDAIRPTVEAVLHAHAVPGVAIAVACAADPIASGAIGTDGLGQPIAQDALFPVASITKLGLALTVLRLVDAGALSVSDPLARHVPDAAIAATGVTLRHLLTHTSGLSGEVINRPWPESAQAALGAMPRHSLGTVVDYHNPNYFLLAIVVERVTGRTIQEVYREDVLIRLGIDGTLGGDPPNRFVASALAPEASIERLARGLPTSHLVTSAAGALTLARAFHGTPADYLRAGTRADAIQDHTNGVGGGYGSLKYDRCAWGLGPELRGNKHPHWAPPTSSPHSFGHYGSGGRLAWIDPEVGIGWAVMCTSYLDTGLATRTFMADIGTALLAEAQTTK